jgi:predicted permease
LIPVAVAVVVATVCGVVSERRFRDTRAVAQRVLALMLYVLVPFVSFVNIAHLNVTLAGGAGLGFAYVMVAAVGVSAWAVGRFALGLTGARLGAVICTVVVVNTGYLGYPMTVALLHASALPSAVAYDQLVSGPSLFVIGFAIGAGFGNVATSGTARVRAFLTRNPPLIAAIAGLLAPSSLAPAPLPAISHVVVGGMLVLGFFAVGVYLSSERRQDAGPLLERPDPPVLLALGLRLLVAPMILVGMSALIIRVPSAYLLQSAMPSGISSLVVGHAFGLDQRLIATIIVWGTAIVLVAGVVFAVR